ncbi:MAG: MMPL family transporter [Myxococcota bacterium]|nr:MMPL family transporter [Myxococcota bacterium]
MDTLNERLGSIDMLVVALMSHDFERAKTVLPKVSEALKALPEVNDVEWRNDVALIDQNALLIFPTLQELERDYRNLRDRIRDEVKKRMRLLDEEDDAEAETPGDAFGEYTFSWGEHEQDDGLSNLGRTFRSGQGKYPEYFHNQAYTTIGLKVYPSQSSSDLDFCRRLVEVTRRTIKGVIEREFGGVGDGEVITRIVLGGTYRNALDKAKQIKGDMFGSIGLSIGLLCLVIMLFFRSIRALFCVLVPVVFGVVWTLGIVAMTIGYLNLITAFIAAVLLGLGIDFGLHFYARYREERAIGHDPLPAMLETHRHCGEASLLAAVTTAFGFGALAIADFRGFSQFGIVAAVGVLLSLAAVATVFPAMMFAWERVSPLKLRGYRVERGEAGTIERRRFPLGAKTVLIASVIGLAGLVSAGQIRFEMNFNKLGSKTKKSKSEHARIIYGTTQATAPAVIFAASTDEAKSLVTQLQAMEDTHGPDSRIKSFQSVFTLIPEHQTEKIKWIKKICRKLKRKVRLFDGDPREGADEILARCEPRAFEADDLPAWIKRKFTDKEGQLGEFIFVSPRGSMSDGENVLDFHRQITQLKGLDEQQPLISGKPMVWADVLTSMTVDGQKTTIASLVAVAILLLIFNRSFTVFYMVMLPLMLGIGLSVGLMVLLDIKLNFFNMLALPTLIGMGVDDGVHMMHRYRELGPGSAWYVVRSTGSAVLLTSVTTSIGFGSLLYANHYGLNSLGLLSMVGIGAALLTTLVVLPAAMQWRDQQA